MQAGVYLNDWSGGDPATLRSCFDLSETELQGVNILLASYSRDPCRGEAFVLFVKDGVLYEVNALHDSLIDLRGQWEPEDTFVEALRYRLDKGTLGKDREGVDLFADELRFLLEELEHNSPGELSS